nr:immunoglobulin heavy chain junction region [Macaca mulatta]MOW25945.1 immunoglobulin heavy chain junction region [Macaca mulatta]MOW25952.1 immunoglobulin heavy chain junction region [Macaca mulatta]MOW26385.1 immunoglobulin heavy chain junction region [Macaca mulatta]
CARYLVVSATSITGPPFDYW